VWKTCPLPMPSAKNGWPSVTYPGVEPNSPKAIASVTEESVGACLRCATSIAYALGQNYYTLLDSKCPYFKTVPGGGVGWFAHLYSDYQEPGYGILDANMKLKFDFAPRTSC
jgi:hypothetical protein